MRRSELVHTYSIIAVDAEAGVMGGAVQSHYFSVGGTVIWAEAGAGVVATQAMVNPEYGPRGVAGLQQGMTARAVLDGLTGEDKGSAIRQAAVLDCRGGIAAFTGEKTIREAGHVTGKNFSCQANMMLNAGVPAAMARGFESAEGNLAERLLSALKAAEATGGDIRGRQSAALTIVSLENRGSVRGNNLLDLRVEDDPEPLIEMERLLRINRAYKHADRGDLALEKGDKSGAMAEYRKAEELLPENLELKFWKGVALLNLKDFEPAAAVLAPVFEADENWGKLLRRLPSAGITGNDKETRDFIARWQE